jgi:hypothetical protein
MKLLLLFKSRNNRNYPFFLPVDTGEISNTPEQFDICW